MARITVEDCLKKVDNRFGLIHLAAKRVRQLKKGVEPVFVCKNKEIVVALREIAAGDVFQTKGDDARYLIETPSETQTETETQPDSVPEKPTLENDPEIPDLETGEEEEAPEEK